MNIAAFAQAASAPNLKTSVEGATSAKSGEILSLTVKVENNAAEEFSGNLQIRVPDGMVLMNKETIPVKLSAAAQRYYPIKVQLDKGLASGQHAIDINLLGGNGRVQSRTAHDLAIQPYRMVTLQSLDSRILMQTAGESLTAEILVRNLGNIKEDLKIVISLPNFADQNSRRFEEIKLSLGPNQDSTLNYTFTVLRPMLDRDQFEIQFNGLYPNDDIFGNTQVIVQNTTATRSFRYPDYQALSYTPNQISVVGRNLLNQYPNFYVYGNGSVQREASTLDFSFNLNQASYGGGPVAYNTWAKYDRDNKGFTIGNLSENAEKYLYGRGLKVHFGDSAQTNTTEIGLMDKSYSLFEPLPGLNALQGFSAFATTTLGTDPSENLAYRGTALYDRDPYEMSESWLLSSSMETMKKRKGAIKSLKFMLGGGLTRFWEGDLPGSPLAGVPGTGEISRAYKPSLAGGLNLYGDWKQFQFNTSGFLSGGYYPGNRRGTTQFNQRISRKISSANTWAEYYYTSYQPKYMVNNPYFQSFFMTERSELGFGAPAGSFFNLSFGPRFEREKGTYFLAGSNVPETFSHSNLRMFGNLSWRSRNNNHVGTLLVEGGKLISSSYQPQHAWNSRSQLSLNFYGFQISSSYQLGIFNLMDFVYDTENLERPSRFSSAVSWNKNFFDNRIGLNLNASYYNDRNFGENRSGNARLHWNIKNTQLFTHGQIYTFKYGQNTSKPYYDFQIGITQKFRPSIKGRTGKKGNLKLKVFYDLNKNGIFDGDDQLATSKSILIKNTLFLTGKEGQIEYKKVPYGPYTVQIPVEDGWYADDLELDLLSKKIEIEIPLYKSSTLRGKIAVDFDPIKNLDADLLLEGYSIVARAKSGKTYRSKTDNNGNYMIFLPEGGYEVYLLETEMPPNVYSEIKTQYVICEPEKINEAPTFILKVKEKEIEIKRFGR